MKLLIYTTHRTGSTSLANFLMFNFGYDYQRFNYFKNNMNKLPNDIIIKLTPTEIDYNNVHSLFDKRIVLIREDTQSQSESRVYSEVYGKKFSSYKIPNSFLYDYNYEIESMKKTIILENEKLKSITNCLVITYEQLFNSGLGIGILETYLDTKFKFNLEYNPYRNMVKHLV